MAKRLPYRATTTSGNQFEFDFPLHPDTGSGVHVHNLLSALLETLDRELKQLGAVSNGDVLQSLAMVLAVRTRMLPGDPERMAGLTRHLLEQALSAPAAAAAGNVPPGGPRPLH
jgi:hypothetical protein